MDDQIHKGSCLCGAVRFVVTGPMRNVVACHCNQCRKQSGHYYAATSAPAGQVSITGKDMITWYEASESARRGFCRICGSALFWKPHDEDRLAILAGSFDGPTGLRLDRHIHTESKGDYYEIEEPGVGD